MNKTTRFLALCLVLIAIVGSIFYLEKDVTPVITETPNTVVTVGSPYQELANPSGFVNSESFELSDYIGKKVILIDFWTYTCINCQRTQPYLNDWWSEYEDDGLLIVGVHTPEFDFEKELANVEAAVKEEGIGYPVVLDNDRGTWEAYGNRYWPRKYLIDLSGNVVYDLIGEGSYEETEAKIQEVLGVGGDMTTPVGTVDVDFNKVVSPETYFGSERGNNVEMVTIEPLSLSPHVAYLVGDWEQEGEYAVNTSTKSTVLYHYDAKNVYMVAAVDPLSSMNPFEVEVWLDGQYVKTITVTGNSLYPIIEGSDYGSHTLKLVPKSTYLHIYTFTFG